MTQYVAYLRDSGGNRQDFSTARQKSTILKWASDNAHEIGRIFSDEARSGSSTVGRESFLDMVKYLDGKTPERGVVVWELSRISRSFDDAQYFVAGIRRNGYEVISLADSIPTGPVGKLIESITMYASEDERSRMRERVKSGLAYLVHIKHCWPNGRTPPIGFAYQEVMLGMRRDGTPHIGRQLIEDIEASARVRKAFEMRSTGYSHAEIHAETHLCKRSNSYHSVFTNRLYLGEFSYGGTTSTDFCEPIIDQVLFDAVQRISSNWAERLGITSPRRGTSSFLLSGLVYCELCGKPLIGRRDTKHNKANYICIQKSHPSDAQPRCQSHAIQSKRLDKIVITRVLDLLDNHQVLEDLQAEMAKNQGTQDIDRQNKLQRAHSDLAEIMRIQGNITSAIKAAGHSKALIAELQKAEIEEAKIREQVNTLERQKPAPIHIPDLNLLALSVRLALESADHRTLQLLLREIIVEIKVQKEGTYRGPITGHLRYSLGFEGLYSL